MSNNMRDFILDALVDRLKRNGYLSGYACIIEYEEGSVTRGSVRLIDRSTLNVKRSVLFAFADTGVSFFKPRVPSEPLSYVASTLYDFPERDPAGKTLGDVIRAAVAYLNPTTTTTTTH